MTKTMSAQSVHLEDTDSNKFNPCIIIPVYNHESALPNTIAALSEYQLPIILIDDGSSSACTTIMQRLCDDYTSIHYVAHATNLGKGQAVKTGLKTANQLGYTHALQIDADGQHSPQHIPQFIGAAQQHSTALIAGYPEYDHSVPKGRLYARYLTHVWVWINTLSFSQVKDSMCGFRVYPVANSVIIADNTWGNRMDFDTEFMVRWAWKDTPIKWIHTPVRYPEDGISHFLPGKDNLLISWMHTRLFFGMLLRSPTLLYRRLFRNTNNDTVK